MPRKGLGGNTMHMVLEMVLNLEGAGLEVLGVKTGEKNGELYTVITVQASILDSEMEQKVLFTEALDRLNSSRYDAFIQDACIPNWKQFWINYNVEKSCAYDNRKREEDDYTRQALDEIYDEM